MQVKKIFLLGFLLFVLAYQLVFVLGSRMQDPGDISNIGVYDFQYYYCPFQIFKRGENPYDHELLNAEMLKQLKLFESKAEPEPMIFIYPPWLLIAMAPVLSLSPKIAPLVWLLFNMCFLVFSGVLICRASCPEQRIRLPCVVATVFFMPAFQTMHWGQISLFITFGVALFYWAYLNRKDYLAGAALLILAIKPHLFVLFGVFLLWHIIIEKRFKVLLSAVFTLGLLLLLVEMVVPGISIQWLTEISIANQHSQNYKNAVFADALQGVFLDVFDVNLFWIGYALLGLAAAVLCVLLVTRNRYVSSITMLPGVLCLFMFVAPYGWYYDHTVLLLTQVSLVALALRPSVPKRTRNLVLVLLLAFQFICAVLSIVVLESQHQFFWFPLAMFFIWFWSIKRLDMHRM